MFPLQMYDWPIEMKLIKFEELFCRWYTFKHNLLFIGQNGNNQGSNPKHQSNTSVYALMLNNVA